MTPHATPRAPAEPVFQPSSGDDRDHATGGLRPWQAWYSVAVLTLANISGAIDRQIFTSLVGPVKRDLGLSDTQISLLMGFGFSVFFSIFGLAIGRLVDRRRRTWIVALGAMLWSVLTAATGAARSYAQLLLTRVGVGVGEATLTPAAVSLIADAFPRRRLGTAMSVYMLGTFFGSGVSYALGAWVVSQADAPGLVTVPLLGAVHPWQTVFIIIGLPGLLVAALAFTVREPRRAVSPSEAPDAGRAELRRYLRTHTRTMTALCLGFMCSASVNWGIGAWLQAFFVRTHGWSVAEAGALQGALTMGLGPLGTMLGGWLADRDRQRGLVDAPLRVGMLGAAGMLLCAGAYPLVGSATVAAALLVPVNLFAAMPWGAANAAVAEALPSRLRGQGAAIFQLLVGLAGGIGPTAVALLTDQLFGADAALRWSLAIVTVVGMTLTLVILGWGRPAYRHTVTQLSRGGDATTS